MFGCTFYFLTFKSLVEITAYDCCNQSYQHYKFFEILPQQVIDN